MHILLADGSKATALPVVTFLEQRGHRVTYVKDGFSAVEAYQTELPDLVLMDVAMPKMDGVEATRRIKAIDTSRWIPVILMTTLSASQDIVAGLNAGADDHLIRPLIHEVLEACMNSMQRIATMQDSLTGILDNVYEAILTIDMFGIVQSYNRAAERIFGYAASEVIGSNVKMLMPSPYAEEHDGYLSRYMQEGTPHVIGIGRKVHGQRKNGEIFPMRLAVTEMKHHNGSHFIGLVSDISAEEFAREHVEFLALHDALTGLPNRISFNDALEQACAHATERSSALLFIDLDGFKPVNDQYGHPVGDEVLITVAKRMRHSLADSDMVARVGGDEFVVLLVNSVDASEAAAVAMRLQDAIRQPMNILGHSCLLDASIGIAFVPAHGETASKVLNAADHAMYAAKRAGRGRIKIAE